MPKPLITDNDIPCFLHDATTPGFSAITLFSDKTKTQEENSYKSAYNKYKALSIKIDLDWLYKD